MIHATYHTDNTYLSMYLRDLVLNGREDRTMYERLLPIIDTIISRFKEFEYKWGFLFEFNNQDLL